MCGCIWDIRPGDLYRYGCPRCAGIEKKNQEIFVNELEEKFPKKYTVIGQYINDSVHVAIRCNICGYIWQVRPNHILRGSGCPNCNNLSKGSKLQNLVSSYLISNYDGVLYHEQDCDLCCVNPVTNYKLLYDNEFVFKNNKLIIEVNGAHHYVANGFNKTRAKHFNSTPEKN